MTTRLPFLLAAALLAPHAQADDRLYLDWTGVRTAWNLTRGAGVTIATLDTGVNYELPEFRGRIAREADGSYGYDAVNGCRDPIDRFEGGIGTQVASVIAGNEFGVAPEAMLVPVRVFDEYGGGSLDFVTRGMDYAIDRGAKIIEIAGGPFHLENEGERLCAAFRRAEDRGALLVFSAGNEGVNLDAIPSGCPLRNVVAVAALNAGGDLTSYSNFGFPAVHLAAPAENIWRIGRDGSVRKDGQGTSFSSAYAAGVAALVWSQHPEYRASDVKSALIRGSVARPSLLDKILAGGYLNAALALKAKVDPTTP